MNKSELVKKILEFQKSYNYLNSLNYKINLIGYYIFLIKQDSKKEHEKLNCETVINKLKEMDIFLPIIDNYEGLIYQLIMEQQKIKQEGDQYLTNKASDKFFEELFKKFYY